MAIAFTYVESTNIVVVTGGTSGTPATFADFVAADRTVATSACSIASGAQLKAAAAVAADTDITLTYPMRPVEQKALRLAITTAQAGGAALSGDETVDVFGTNCVWYPITGASASGQKVVPLANLTHGFAVGDTVILIDISAPATYETDVIASISEGVSITLTNNNTNSYATADIVGIYQTENIAIAAFGTAWTTKWYGQIAILTFTGFDGTNTAKVDQPQWGVVWNLGDGQYRVDSLFTVGNGATSTYFAATKIRVIHMAKVSTTTNSNLRYGVYNSGKCNQGCTVVFDCGSSGWAPWHGVTEIYNTKFIYGLTEFKDYSIQCFGITKIQDFFQDAASGGIWRSSQVWTNSANVGGFIIDLKAYNCICVFNCPQGDTVSGLYAYDCTLGVYIAGLAPGTYTYKNITSLGSTYGLGFAWESNVTANVINSSLDFSAILWGVYLSGTIIVYEQYYCDMHIADKDGVNLASATVLCQDQNGNTIFSVSTDAAGNIAQQTITYKKYWWQTTPQTTVTYSPHKFTISKAGYETLVLDNVTISAPIKWHLELQPPPVSPNYLLGV